MAYSKTALKQEPRAEKPTFEPDVDVYEETDECDLENSGQMIWLVKLPQFIQDRWDNIPSDSEEVIELGTVLINKTDPTVRFLFILSIHLSF